VNNLSALEAEIVDAVRQTLAQRTLQPRATYRLQFHRDHCTFRDAAALVPYLSQLGISHVYASPYLKAKCGSEHGYAVVDYTRLDPELGTEDDFEAFVDALREHGMGQILDVVPNHMSAAPGENPWWTDVLENGPGSPYADFFDIDWAPVKEELRGKILFPILGRQFGEVLEAGELKLCRCSGPALHLFFTQIDTDCDEQDRDDRHNQNTRSIAHQPFACFILPQLTIDFSK